MARREMTWAIRGVVIALLLLLGVRPARAGKLNGESCSSGSECNSTFCVEGVCCNNLCSAAPCTSCNVPGRVGTCGLVPAGPPLGGRTCTVAGFVPDAACVASPACNGKYGDCVVTVGKDCVPARCDAALFTPAAKCSSEGKCIAVASQDCAPFGCTLDGCRRSCAVDSECAGGFSCVAGNCVTADTKCSDDGLSSIDRTRQATPCAPYRCGDGGRCWQTCSNSDQCANGFACEFSSGKCVSTEAASDDTGCGLAATPAGSPPSALWLLAGSWLLGAARARRAVQRRHRSL